MRIMPYPEVDDSDNAIVPVEVKCNALLGVDAVRQAKNVSGALYRCANTCLVRAGWDKAHSAALGEPSPPPIGFRDGWFRVFIFRTFSLKRIHTLTNQSITSRSLVLFSRTVLR